MDVRPIDASNVAYRHGSFIPSLPPEPCLLLNPTDPNVGGNFIPSLLSGWDKAECARDLLVEHYDQLSWAYQISLPYPFVFTDKAKVNALATALAIISGFHAHTALVDSGAAGVTFSRHLIGSDMNKPPTEGLVGFPLHVDSSGRLSINDPPTLWSVGFNASLVYDVTEPVRDLPTTLPRLEKADKAVKGTAILFARGAV